MMSFDFDPLDLVKVSCVIENKSNKMGLFIKRYHHDDVLLFNVMHGWSPIFRHDTLSVDKLRSVLPYITVCFLKCERFSTFLPVFFLLLRSQVDD